MKIQVVGINHKTAPIEVREKFYLRDLEQELLLSELKSYPSIIEAIVVSTCNRTEIYVNTISNFTPDSLIGLLAQIKHLDITSPLKKHFYSLTDQVAVDHFFRVATGLDSLVLGEKQILGQIKAAVNLSRKKGMLSSLFNILSNLVIQCGKKAQNETSIGAGGSSVSWAAVTMAENMIETLSNKSVLIIGAGKMSTLTGRQLKSKNVKDLYIMNRTTAHAAELAEQIGGKIVPFSEIEQILKKVDVCICSVNAPHIIVERNLVTKVMAQRRNKKLLLLDISMPRNIDPNVAKIENVLLFSIDDLDKVVEDNMEKRKDSSILVEQIIAQKISEFYDQLRKMKERKIYNYKFDSINKVSSIPV